MFKKYLLFCVVFGAFYIFLLAAVATLLFWVALIPWMIFNNPFGISISYLLGFYLIYLFIRIFIWKIPRSQWKKAGFKNKYYFFLPISWFLIILFLGSIAIVPDKNKFRTRESEASSSIANYAKASQAYFINYGELAKSSKDLSEYFPVVGCEKNIPNYCKKTSPINHSQSAIKNWFLPSGYYEIEMYTLQDKNIFIAKPIQKYYEKLFVISSCHNAKNNRIRILEKKFIGTTVEIASCE